MKSKTGADIGDKIMFLSSNPRNHHLPKKTSVDKVYEISAIDSDGKTRFLKNNGKSSMSGCDSTQIGEYIIVCRC